MCSERGTIPPLNSNKTDGVTFFHPKSIRLWKSPRRYRGTERLRVVWFDDMRASDMHGLATVPCRDRPHVPVFRREENGVAITRNTGTCRSVSYARERIVFILQVQVTGTGTTMVGQN